MRKWFFLLFIIPVILSAGSIDTTSLLKVTDNIAYTVQKLKALVGITDSSGTLSYIADSLVARINAFTDDEVTADLLQPAKNSLQYIKVLYLKICRNIVSALDAHIGEQANQTLNDYWNDSLSSRMAPEFVYVARDAGIDIDPELVFPPVTILAKDSINASPPAKTYTDSSEINLNYYGDGDLELQVVRPSTLICSVYVIGKDLNGSKYKGLGVIPPASGAGTVWSVSALISGQRCYDVDSTTLIRGTAAGVYRIQTKVDRTVAE
jgi:hypothetical protein